jgi:NitT/TauT family transport system permease protein
VRRFGPLLVLLGLLAIWQVGAMALRADYLPTPVAVLPDLRAMLIGGDIWGDMGASLYRLAVGFAIGLAAGVPLGIVCGRSIAVRQCVNPLLALFYPVPKAALIPILMLWFGAGDLSKILIITLTVSLPIVYHAQQGAAAVEEKLLWSARAISLSSAAILWRVVLPASLPELLLGVRVGIVIGLIVMISSEMIVRQNGLGYDIFNAMDMAQYTLTYAVIVIVGVLGYVLDSGFEALRRRLTFWAPQRQAIVAASS